MWKAILLRLAFGLVVDLLLSVATAAYQKAEDEKWKNFYQNVVEFLINIKSNGLPNGKRS